MTDPATFNWKQYIEEVLAATPYCALGTIGQKGSWTNPVFFAWDTGWNLYFVSLPASRHMQNITKDGRVSMAIYATDQDTKGDVRGIQLSGTAEVTRGEAREEAMRVYFTRAEGQEASYRDWEFVKMTVSDLYYFDTRFFEENRMEVPRHVYS
jgi:nitroimidazol reductase NimA-like FMN-containing flavoprotein (pyridoxamine 5'-phosphate oxidase superfamily)